MKKRDLTIERITACMVMESECSGVFHIMALDFPDEKELWSRIAAGEEQRAEIIAQGMGLRPSTEYGVSPEFIHIRKTIDYASEIKKVLVEGKVSLKDALGMVIRLREYKKLGYSSDLLGKERDERVKKVFRRLFELDEAHAALIRSVAERYGLDVPRN
ncbi:MAG: hypothetical protein P8Z71_13595 [Candidatus Sulfobium sp.]|jgi:hypothetical protein